MKLDKCLLYPRFMYFLDAEVSVVLEYHSCTMLTTYRFMKNLWTRFVFYMSSWNFIYCISVIQLLLYLGVIYFIFMALFFLNVYSNFCASDLSPVANFD
jgi:hypothetical protein